MYNDLRNQTHNYVCEPIDNNRLQLFLMGPQGMHSIN